MITRWLIKHLPPPISAVLLVGLVLGVVITWLIVLVKLFTIFAEFSALALIALFGLGIILAVLRFLVNVYVEEKREEWDKPKRRDQEEAPVVWMQINDEQQDREQEQSAHSNGPQPDTELRLR